MLQPCRDSPDRTSAHDENAKFERRYKLTNDSSLSELEPRWIKLCNEGYKLDNGESFVKVTCSQNEEWSLSSGNPIPR